MSAQDQSFYSDVIRYFDRAAAFTQHPSGLLDQIKRCNSVYRFEFPLSRSDGDVGFADGGFTGQFDGTEDCRSPTTHQSCEAIA